MARVTCQQTCLEVSQLWSPISPKTRLIWFDGQWGRLVYPLNLQKTYVTSLGKFVTLLELCGEVCSSCWLAWGWAPGPWRQVRVSRSLDVDRGGGRTEGPTYSGTSLRTSERLIYINLFSTVYKAQFKIHKHSLNGWNTSFRMKDFDWTFNRICADSCCARDTGARVDTRSQSRAAPPRPPPRPRSQGCHHTPGRDWDRHSPGDNTQALETWNTLYLRLDIWTTRSCPHISAPLTELT